MKVVPSVLISSLSGKAGDVVAANWKGRCYVRRRVIPANPQTVAQVAQRDAMARTVALWQGLIAALATFLNKLGSDEALAGYNIFTRLNVKGEATATPAGIVPANRYAAALQDFAVATGAGAAGTLALTWSAGDYLATDTILVFYRKVSAVAAIYETPWIHFDAAAFDMADEAATVTGLVADTEYAVAMIPYDTTAAAYGAGDCGVATSVAA